MLLRLVDTRFQGLFTPLAGVLFAFPSWYWFTIGRQVVFSLGRWSSQIPTGLLEPRGTQEPARESGPFRLRGCHPLWPDFPDCSAKTSPPMSPALQPRYTEVQRFGLFPVRSPLLGESRFDFFS